MIVAATIALSCAGGANAGSGAAGAGEGAAVTAVEVSGEVDARTFSVTILSPDTGCERYADWWEVVDESSEALVFRRVLTHSHVDEQPFTRSGGPFALQGDTTVIVRAHMNPDGYGEQAVRGTIDGGFEAYTVPGDFGADLATEEPLPTGCAF